MQAIVGTAGRRRRLVVRHCAAALVLASVLGSAWAQPGAAEQGPAWSNLSRQQQVALAPLQRDWKGIDATRKEKWLDVAARFQAMAPEERARVQERMAEWARMTPAERGRARLQFQQTRQLPAQDRQQRWEAYQSLPDEQRRALAAQAAAKPAAADSRRNGAPPAAADGKKRNVVGGTAASNPTPKWVAPTVVQAKPGATTTLVSKPASPPVHHQPGLPKIAATKGFVDQATLLPKRGPQGAAVAAAPSASRPESNPP